MAKRLNKKVAIIGSLVLAMLIVAAIVVIPFYWAETRRST